MRARAKQANLETRKANEILLSFKKLDAQRELEADAAIEGVMSILCLRFAVLAALCYAVLGLPCAGAALCCAAL